MLKYIGRFNTGVPEDVLNVPFRTYYFHETSTDVVYIMSVYYHNLNVVDHMTPLVKPDGALLTYPEWIATQDDERDERVLEKVRDCSDCNICSRINQIDIDYDLER